ncbi:MAG: DUF6141 family protein [Candidatus Eisenbacteria bacterium]
MQVPMLFREVQRMRSAWVWGLVLISPTVLLYAVLRQIVWDHPFGDHPAPDGLLIVMAVVFGLGLPVLFWILRLETEVRADGLYVRYFPFHPSFRRIPIEGLRRWEVRTYSPIREYGGWGIRQGRRGRAYNASGNRGVELEFNSGERILIGSQHPDQLAAALDSLRSPQA